MSSYPDHSRLIQQLPRVGQWTQSPGITGRRWKSKRSMILLCWTSYSGLRPCIGNTMTQVKSNSAPSWTSRVRPALSPIFISNFDFFSLSFFFGSWRMHRRLSAYSIFDSIETITLLSGSYCSQSSRYSTATKASKLLEIEPVLEAARRAKENGSTRFCMGAAWRDLAGRKRGFERILEMVREVRGMGMEVCTTLGMLSPEQARQLKEAYVVYFIHLDTYLSMVVAWLHIITISTHLENSIQRSVMFLDFPSHFIKFHQGYHDSVVRRKIGYNHRSPRCWH